MLPAYPRVCLLAVLPSACGCSDAARVPSPSPEQVTDATCERVADAAPLAQPAPAVETVVAGLEIPWSIAFLQGAAAPGVTPSFLVSERPGRLRLVVGGQLQPDPVLTFPAAENGEGGLLGMALHPGFGNNRWLYIYRTRPVPGGAVNRVERYDLAADARSATLDRLIIDNIPAAPFHDGGRIHFGPDGRLYVATGDAGVPENAQQLTSLSGKILRLADDGSIPTDNPFAEQPVALLGVRNVEGFDWLDERVMVIADHGPSGELGLRGNDEVNVAQVGNNLGWPRIHGCEAQSGLVTPRVSWVSAFPPGGLAIFRGPGSWQGAVVVAALGARELDRIVLGPDHNVRVHEAFFRGDPPTGFGRLRAVVNGPDGALYVTTSNCDGRGTCPAEKDKVLRVVPP